MSPLAPWGYPAFRRLVVARTITYLGNAVATVALAFAVLDLTGAVSALGLVVGARSAANVVVLLLGGVLADRLPRALVLTGSELLAAGSQAVVAVLVLTGSATVPMLVVLGVVNGAAAALALPASSALLPQTVPDTVLRQANGLARLGTSTALVGGAALGGILVAATGPGWGLAVDAASFAVAGALFAGVRVAPSAGGAPTTSVLTDLRDGWAEFRSRTWVWVVVAQFGVVNAALAGSLTVLGPVVADATFGRVGWGVVLAAESLGLVLGGVLAILWLPVRALRYGVALTALAALPLVALAVRPGLAVVVAAAFLAGVAVEQFSVAWDVSLQQNVPTERLARVYSYDALGSFAAIPVAQVALGPLAAGLGTSSALLVCAGLVVVTSLAALSRSAVRELRVQPRAVG